MSLQAQKSDKKLLNGLRVPKEVENTAASKRWRSVEESSYGLAHVLWDEGKSRKAFLENFSRMFIALIRTAKCLSIMMSYTRVAAWLQGPETLVP